MAFASRKLLFDSSITNTEINWNSITLPVSGKFYGSYGNGLFVAVSSNSSDAIYSSNGINWTQSNLPYSRNWTCVAWGGSYIALSGIPGSSSNNAAKSGDAASWTALSLPSSYSSNSLVFGNGKFVTISFGKVLYSSDGVNWTQGYTFSGYTALPWYVTYGNNKFVAVYANSNIGAYSNDGVTWNTITLPSSKSFSDITYGGGKFVAVNTDSPCTCAISNDGTSWSEFNMPEAGGYGYTKISYNGNTFVAIPINSNISAYSNDAVNWSTKALPSSGAWSSIISDNNIFVAFKSGSNIAAYTT